MPAVLASLHGSTVCGPEDHEGIALDAVERDRFDEVVEDFEDVASCALASTKCNAMKCDRTYI